MKHALTLAAALAASLWCAGASAQLAYTSQVVNMRAGPAREYPIVAVLPAGLQVDVQGCLGDYRWCDVVAGGSRGWVYAGNISYAHQNTYEPLLYWGPVVGLAILGFTVDDYWQQHYRGRPWYGERYRWRQVPPPPPRQWRAPPHGQPPSGWAPPHAQPPSPGWAPGQHPSHRPPSWRGQQPPPSGWAPAPGQQAPSARRGPPQGQPPGAAPPPRQQQRPAGRPDAAAGQARQRPQPSPPGAAPVPRPQPQPGAAVQPRPQPVPRAAPQPQPDNSGRGQPQNP